MAEAFDLSVYMNDSIREIIGRALRASLRNPRESLFLARQSLAQRQAASRRARRAAQGQHIPPFLIASMADRCSLHCLGCYFHAGHAGQSAPSNAGPGCTDPGCVSPLSAEPLSAQRWSELFQEASELGVSFILLAGGEPLMNRPVLEAAARVKRIVFPVFTNGTMFDDAALSLFDRNRNLLPVFSLEGPAEATDARRGAGTHAQAMAAMARLHSRGAMLGASITITTENHRMVSSPAFIGELARKGCSVIFWVEYVPVTPGSESLAIGDAERRLLADRQSECRRDHPGVIILSFPGDEKYTGGCLAAGRGFFHINASGGAEPCPFSPYSDVSLKEASLAEALMSPLFQRLAAGGLLLDDHMGGCLLFAKEETVRTLIGK